MRNTQAQALSHAPLSASEKSALEDLPVYWVKDQGVLDALVNEIDSLDRVALDTEFIKRDTYYPILALVQVNTGQAIYLIDAPRLDLSEFWMALSELPEMIWYACGEDLGIFYELSKCAQLNNVFDVQVGVAYLSGDLQLGYSRAVADVLGVELAKSESQSDWLVRPLSVTQEQYAADDVRYLLVLYDRVRAALDVRGLLGYAQEDSIHYAHELYEARLVADEALYLDHLAPYYTHEEVTLLQLLMAWRERLARTLNEPKTFIISKQALREIVENKPTSPKALSYTSINRGSLRKYGDHIIALVHEARTKPEYERPPMPIPCYHSKEKPFKKALSAAITAHANALGVPSNLLLKNRWLQALYLQVAYPERFDELPAAMKGYRSAWVVEVILPLLSEHRAHFLTVFEGD